MAALPLLALAPLSAALVVAFVPSRPIQPFAIKPPFQHGAFNLAVNSRLAKLGGDSHLPPLGRHARHILRDVASSNGMAGVNGSNIVEDKGGDGAEAFTIDAADVEKAKQWFFEGEDEEEETACASTELPSVGQPKEQEKKNFYKPIDSVIRSALALKHKISRGKGKLAASENIDKLREYACVLLAGLCLSFNSGYINGCCLSGLLNSGKGGPGGVAVSAFTGGYTKAGLALAAGQFSKFGFELSMILSFIGGSCLSGFINPRPEPRQMGPTYGPSFIIGSGLLAIASVLSSVRPNGRALFYFAAMANGLQNGMSSMYSANLIRSTHMTGISTDIGMIWGQMLRGNTENAWKGVILSGLATFFGLGSAVSYYAVSKFRSSALVFNACFFFAIGMGCIAFTAAQQKVSLWQAASGRWQWEKALDSLAVSLENAEGLSKEFLMELFDRVDADGSGFIDEDELKMVLKEAGMSVSDGGVRAMIRMVDTDGDGVISREELINLVQCDPDGECEIVASD